MIYEHSIGPWQTTTVLFIIFQHAGYEIIASEHSHAHHWGFPDYEPVVEVFSGILTWQVAVDDEGRDAGSSVPTSLNSRWSASSQVSANVLWFCGRNPCLIAFWSVLSSLAFPLASSMPYHAWEAYVSRLRNVDCVTSQSRWPDSPWFLRVLMA